MQCHAHSKSSGRQCGNDSIQGGTVCRMHGGAASQVREAAKLRLLELVDPALATLARSVKQKGIPGPVEIAAARDILDRAGLGKPGQEIEVAAGGNGGPEIRVTIRSVLDEVGDLPMIEE